MADFKLTREDMRVAAKQNAGTVFPPGSLDTSLNPPDIVPDNAEGADGTGAGGPGC